MQCYAFLFTVAYMVASLWCHACGFCLANKGVATRALQQYLGHRNIQHIVRYAELTLQRFQNFWDW